MMFVVSVVFVARLMVLVMVMVMWLVVVFLVLLDMDRDLRRVELKESGTLQQNSSFS